jgi:hypothetical protein
MAHYTQDCVEALVRKGRVMNSSTIERYAGRISELEIEKRQQRADIEALVRFTDVMADKCGCCDGEIGGKVNEAWESIQLIIERYRVEGE